MNKQNKISLKNGYTLTINENDIVSIKVETEDDILEFDGREGNLMDASDFESHFNEEEEEMTLDEIIYGTTEFLKDWGVEPEVVEAIIKDLTPWFERYAVEQPTADEWLKVLEKRVETLKLKEELYKEGIVKQAERFKAWVNEADVYDLVDDAVYKAEQVKNMSETYREAWTN